MSDIVKGSIRIVVFSVILWGMYLTFTKIYQRLGVTLPEFSNQFLFAVALVLWALGVVVLHRLDKKPDTNTLG